MSTFEACREPLTADELADCVVLTSCGISDEYEAQAAICATGHDVECACVNDEDKCYEFVSAVVCPDIADATPTSLTSTLFSTITPKTERCAKLPRTPGHVLRAAFQQLHDLPLRHDRWHLLICDDVREALLLQVNAARFFTLRRFLTPGVLLFACLVRSACVLMVFPATFSRS